MASITVYDAYVPLLTRSLDSLEAILTKAQTHAAENGINVDTEYATARLHETMEPLTFQIQIFVKIAQNIVKVATGAIPEAWNADKITFEEMFARIRKSRDLLQTVSPEDVNSKAGKETDVQVGSKTQRMLPEVYIQRFLLPNAFFHLQTTYGILRMKGVPLGKMDFLGSFLA